MAPPRASLIPLLLLLAVAACAGPTDDDDLAAVDQEVLVCGDGTYATWCYADTDGDGRGAGAGLYACHCGSPGSGTAHTATDCDPGNGSRWQNLSCYPDNDDDGVGAGSLVTTCAGSSCEAGTTHRTHRYRDDGVTLNNSDCDDGDDDRWQDLSCYVDGDGDHYGTGTTSTTCAGRTCADGVGNRAHSAGDCNDGNAAIRPHRDELAGNGVDDDCTGAADEAKAVFLMSGNGNTSSGFTVRFELNSAAELAAASGGTIYARVHYRKLSAASGSYTITAPTAMGELTVLGTTYVSVALTGLSDLTVYQVRADFYSNAAGTTRIAPLSGCAGTSASGTPCSNTDVYYTITKPAGTDVPVKTMRSQVVLNALYELYYFRNHALGNWDDSLAQRYELPERDAAYCSEFYAAAGKPFLADLNPCDFDSSKTSPDCDSDETSKAEDYVGDVRLWFSPFANAAFDYTGAASMADRKPGDYLGINASAAETDGSHSQMFLAWDPTVQKYWYVEGNGSYTNNGWGRINHTVNVGSTSHCDPGGWYCPASASECGSGADACYRIKTIGALNNSNMLE